MKHLAAHGASQRATGIWTMLGVTLAVFVILEVAGAQKVAFYIDAIDRTGLLYALPLLAIVALVVLLAYPRLPVFALAFLLVFNFVGGYWGNNIVLLIAKVASNVLSVAAILTTFLAPAEDRAWLTRTRLGHAVIAWLAAVALGVLVGSVSAPNHGYWLRESGWMLFFFCVLPFGTMLRGRDDIRRVVWWVSAGVAALQVYAFWLLMTGRRFTRPDAWEGGQTFFRAPYSCESLFVLYLAAAALFYYSSAKQLTRRASVILFVTIALLGGGFLASMVRSLWVSGTVGAVVLLFLVPWDRRTARAALMVAVGGILALGVVAVFDSLSAESSGNWTANALTFLLDLGSKDSASRVTREIEWAHAIDLWKTSPLVGLGFGYPFPQIDYGKLPDSLIPEAFYMHNSYLNILAKCGAFGFCALLYLLWVTLDVAREPFRRRPDDLESRILATALIAALVQLAVATSIMPVLTSGDTAAYFGMLVGLVAVARRTVVREANPTSSTV